MTIEEAEKYYKDFMGDSYLMWHETGSEKTKEFHDMNISDEVLAKWDEDILEKRFEWLSELDDRAWHYHVDILRVLELGHIQDITGYVKRLLDVMEEMPDKIDQHNRISIIENMRDDTPFHRSPVRMICERTPYGLRMDIIMRKIMDFKCIDEPESVGFFRGKASDEAWKQEYVEKYNQAFAKYFKG